MLSCMHYHELALCNTIFWALTVDICVQQWTALSCWRSFWPSFSHVLWSIYWLDNVLAVSFCISFFQIIQMNNDSFNINVAVLLKKFSGEEGERVDVQKLFGYIGLFTLVALWWLSKFFLRNASVVTRQTRLI